MPSLHLLQAGLAWVFLQQRQVVEFITLPNPEPERGILAVILDSFVMVGVFLGATVVVGIGVGVVRMWLLRRYPENRFNGRGKDLPRLDLGWRR